MTLHKAAEQAIEAIMKGGVKEQAEAVYALRKALAQQEPDEFCTATTEELMKTLGCSDEKAKEIHDKVEALAQPEQEPIGWMTPSGEGFRFRFEPPTNDVPLGWTPIYTAPPSVEAAVLAEREACAKVCDNGVHNATDWDSSYWDQACRNRAAAIRARGEK